MFFSNYFYTILIVLYNFENALGAILPDLSWIVITYTVTEAIIFLALFILKGVGIYTLSVNNGVSLGWLGFVPFVSLFQLGRLIGPMSLFRIRFKNIGILISILYFVVVVTGSLIDFFAYFEAFERAINSNSVALAFNGEDIVSNIDPQLLLPLTRIDRVLSIIYTIIFIFVISAFFRLYSPRRAIVYSILSVLIDPLLSVFIFVVRKNKKGSFYTYSPFGASGVYGTSDGERSGGYTFNERSASPFSEYEKSKEEKDVFEDYPDKKTSGSSSDSFGKKADDDDLF